MMWLQIYFGTGIFTAIISLIGDGYDNNPYDTIEAMIARSILCVLIWPAIVFILIGMLIRRIADK